MLGKYVLKYNKLIGENVYGQVVFVDDKDGKEWPTVCRHGGSQWLCFKCGEEALAMSEKCQILIDGDGI